MFDRLYNVNKNLTQCLTKFLILFMSFSDSSKTDQPNIGASDEEGPQLPAMLTSLRLNNDYSQVTTQSRLLYEVSRPSPAGPGIRSIGLGIFPLQYRNKRGGSFHPKGYVFCIP